MPQLNRRNLLQATAALAIPSGVMTLAAGCNQSDSGTPQPTKSDADNATADTPKVTQSTTGKQMKVHYLEIVTPEVDALCTQYTGLLGTTFGEPEANLGGARTAKLDGGGLIGIRAPMHDGEKPVVRPYVLVEDIKASVESASEAGATVALPPMEIPGHGTCAIVFQGGIECGFWQV